MPAPARKTAGTKQKTEPTPAEAAVAEALGDGDIVITVRGQDFVIKNATRLSMSVAMAIAANNTPQLIFELLDPADQDRFLAAGRGVPFQEMATEFFEAIDKASGQGNF